jgi:hypothetical protein
VGVQRAGLPADEPCPRQLGFDVCLVLSDLFLVLFSPQRPKTNEQRSVFSHVQSRQPGSWTATHPHPVRSPRAPSETVYAQPLARLARLSVHALFVAFLLNGSASKKNARALWVWWHA